MIEAIKSAIAEHEKSSGVEKRNRMEFIEWKSLPWIIYLLDELEKRDKVLKDCLAFVEPQVEHHGYGFFPGGNPNLFCPDGEMNTPQEIENWKEACKRWNEGNTNGEPSSHVPLFMGDKVVGSATVARLGMGSYVDVDEEAKALMDSILTTLSKEASHE